MSWLAFFVLSLDSGEDKSNLFPFTDCPPQLLHGTENLPEHLLLGGRARFLGQEIPEKVEQLPLHLIQALLLAGRGQVLDPAEHEGEMGCPLIILRILPPVAPPPGLGGLLGDGGSPRGRQPARPGRSANQSS